MSIELCDLIEQLEICAKYSAFPHRAEVMKNAAKQLRGYHAMQMAIEDIHGEYPLAGPLLEQLKQRAAANLARLMGEGNG